MDLGPYQYLTVDMVRTAKENGRFIDQKQFKTASTYGFDSWILTDASMKVIESYINFVRPLLKPQCQFVLVTRNLGQHSKLGDVMSKLVFDAIEKFIHLSRGISLSSLVEFSPLCSSVVLVNASANDNLLRASLSSCGSEPLKLAAWSSSLSLVSSESSSLFARRPFSAAHTTQCIGFFLSHSAAFFFCSDRLLNV